MFTADVPYTLIFTSDGTWSVYAWFKNAAGNVSAFATDAITLDRSAPIFGSLTATAGAGSVALSWPGFIDTGSGLATSNPYTLVYATGAAPASCASGTPLSVGSATSFTHANLVAGTTYYYRVCAKDNVGNVSVGVTASATPLSGSAPPAGTLAIDGGAAWTDDTAVTLSLAATHAVG